MKLLAKSSLKIVYNLCYVREKINRPRCHRCLESGDIAKACKKTDRRYMYANCGATGHVSKECQFLVRCFSCTEVNDRKTGTMACPEYRALIKGGISENKRMRRMSKVINVLQVNANRSRHSHGLIMADTLRKKTEILPNEFSQQ